MQKTRLLKKETVAEGTMRFTLAKPDGFTYQAGQTIDLTLINPPETDVEGNARTFSLVSAPHEADLGIATRMRGTSFKRVLGAMEEGTEIAFEGPFGSFVLHENSARPAVFIAGGIGITPFHSIIADATERKLPHTIILLYSNRRPEDATFLEELRGFTKQNEKFTFAATMTEMEKSAQSWDGERGHIDLPMLARHVPADAEPIYYLAGPPMMVLAIRDMLKGSGISGDDIRFEEFSGY